MHAVLSALALIVPLKSINSKYRYVVTPYIRARDSMYDACQQLLDCTLLKNQRTPHAYVIAARSTDDKVFLRLQSFLFFNTASTT
jgi:hypothetical protein